MKREGCEDQHEKKGSGWSVLYLVPVSMIPVSVRGRRRMAWPGPLSLGLAGLLPPRLLVGPTLDFLVSLRRTDGPLTVAGLSYRQVALPGSVPVGQIDASEQTAPLINSRSCGWLWPVRVRGVSVVRIPVLLPVAAWRTRAPAGLKRAASPQGVGPGHRHGVELIQQPC